MTYPSFTKTFRKTSYPYIDPSRPELSQKDKTIIITGAGHGSIGADVALAFAQAGARKFGLLGRTEQTLRKTEATLKDAYPNVRVVVAICDITKSESVGTAAHNLRAELGAWDAFLNVAGYLPTPTTLAGADEDDWWKAFEIHAKFSTHFAKHFATKARPNAVYVGTNAGIAHVTSALFPKSSAYAASKLAMAKLDEFLADEHPNLRVFTVHPGVVATAMASKSGRGPGDVPAGTFDEPELPAHFMLWLAGGEADFLRARFVWVNWDAEELLARKADIEADSTLLRITLGGWPFK